MRLEDVASETTIYELYLDLYSLSVAWINKIADSISDAVDRNNQVCLDVFIKPVAAGIKFQTTSQSDIANAKIAARKIIGLAR